MDRTIDDNSSKMDDDLGWGHHVFIDEEGMFIHKTSTYESFDYMPIENSLKNGTTNGKNINREKGINFDTFNVHLSFPSNVNLYTYMFSFCGFVAINMIFTIGKVVIKKY